MVKHKGRRSIGYILKGGLGAVFVMTVTFLHADREANEKTFKLSRKLILDLWLFLPLLDSFCITKKDFFGELLV